jgi:hypothetical protein
MTRTEVTYSQSTKGVRITAERVAQELRSHGIVGMDELGEALVWSSIAHSDLYSASKVLDWLGY